MDINFLVEKITKEVMNELNNNPVESSSTFVNNTYAGSCNLNNDESILIIINSNRKYLDSVISSIKSLSTRYKIKLLLSKNAAKEFNREEIISKTGVTDIFTDSGQKSQDLYNVSSVILPNLTLSTLSKLANQINDCIMIDAIFNAVICGKPVYVCTDFVYYLISMNPLMSSSINQNISKIKQMGIRTIKLPQLSNLYINNIDPSAQSSSSYLASEKNIQKIKNAGVSRIGTDSGFEKVNYPSEVATLIDHTQLKPDVTRDKILTLCKEAKQFNFASVCINPGWVALCAQELKNTAVKVCTVIGFPLGATTTASKVSETREAIANGADEIDMVINIGKLKAKEYDYVLSDIKAVVEAAQGKILKVIIETCLLSDEEKVIACKLCKEAKAHYVKTSTGFAGGGATMADIALMRGVVGPDMGVKASGGVRNYQDALNMIEMGATRIGASASIAIVSGGEGSGGY